jgi:hypothetical protein
LRRIEKPEKTAKRRFSGIRGFQDFRGRLFGNFRFIPIDLPVYPAASVFCEKHENAQTFPNFEFGNQEKFSQISARFSDGFPEFPEFREIGPNFFEIYIVHTIKMAHNIAFLVKNPKKTGISGDIFCDVVPAKFSGKMSRYASR